MQTAQKAQETEDLKTCWHRVFGGVSFVDFGNHRLCRWRDPAKRALASSIERSEQLTAIL